MSFWESLAEGTINGFMTGFGELAKDIRTAITGKEALTSEQQVELLTRLDALEAAAATREHEVMMGQQALTMQEAKSNSLLKSGWRPSLGWACVFGVGYQFVFRPIGTWVLKIVFLVYAAYSEAGLTPALKIIMDEALQSPSLDMNTLLAILGTILGVGAMRTVERVKGAIK